MGILIQVNLKNNKMNGNGIYVNKDGNKISGIFISGKFIDDIKKQKNKNCSIF